MNPELFKGRFPGATAVVGVDVIARARETTDHAKIWRYRQGSATEQNVLPHPSNQPRLWLVGLLFLHSTDLQRSICRMEFRTRLNGRGQADPLVRVFPYPPTTFDALAYPVRWLGTVPPTVALMLSRDTHLFGY